MRQLFFDTETSNKWRFDLEANDQEQPHLVQLAAILRDENMVEKASVRLIILPKGWEIDPGALAVHGISVEEAKRFGVHLENACYLFQDLVYQAELVIGHNIPFDVNVMTRAFGESDLNLDLTGKTRVCTMRTATSVVKARKKRPMHPNDWKWPTLTECMAFFFDEDHTDAHDALADCRGCMRVFDALKERGAIHV